MAEKSVSRRLLNRLDRMRYHDTQRIRILPWLLLANPRLCPISIIYHLLTYSGQRGGLRLD